MELNLTLIQTVSCAFACLVLIGIWRRGRPDWHKEVRARDSGILYLALAIGVWAVASVFRFAQLTAGDTLPIFSLFDSMFSTLNSALILLAVAHFDYGWSGLRFMHHSRRWTVIVVCLALLAGLLPYALDKSFVIPDTVLAFTTLIILGMALCKSFNLRSFRWLSVLSIIALLFTLLATLSALDAKEMTSEFWVGIFSFLNAYTFSLRLLYKVALILIFLSLTTTWAFELAETPPPECVSLHFTGRTEGKRRIVEVTYLGIEGVRIRELTERVFENLRLFARRRVDDEKGDGGCVVLKEIGVQYNALTHIREQLAYPREFLFEYVAKETYKLRIPAANISFADGLDKQA